MIMQGLLCSTTIFFFFRRLAGVNRSWLDVWGLEKLFIHVSSFIFFIDILNFAEIDTCHMKVFEKNITFFACPLLFVYDFFHFASNTGDKEENKACHNHNAKTIHQVITAYCKPIAISFSFGDIAPLIAVAAPYQCNLYTGMYMGPKFILLNILYGYND
ncbi:hypothetical protein ACJX0J_009773, partial [Zea mays]